MALRFQAGCGCCGPCTGTICTTVKDCNNALATGAVISITKDGFSATCTVVNQVVTVTRTAGGSGYTSGTDYALGFTGGGGSGAAGLFDVVAGVVTNLRLTAGGSGYTSAPTVSFPGAGIGSGATATAAIGSRCCVDSLETGTYEVSVNLAGSVTTTSVNLDSCSTKEISVTLNYRICFKVTSTCESINSNAVATVSQGGTTIGTVTLNQTTDTHFPGDTASSCVGVPGPGTYNWSVSHPDYSSPKTGSVTVSSGFCQANVTTTFGDPDVLGRNCDCKGYTGACPAPYSLADAMNVSDGFGTSVTSHTSGAWTACMPNRIGGDWAKSDPPAPPSSCVLQSGNGVTSVRIVITCDRNTPDGGLEFSGALYVPACSYFDPVLAGPRNVIYPEIDPCTNDTGLFVGSDSATPTSCTPLSVTLNFTVPPGVNYDPFRSIYGDSFSVTMSEP